MIELETDMWSEKADAYCITTNGDVNSRGEAVMGRGCALEAKTMFTAELARYLGSILSSDDDDLADGSNHVYHLGEWSAHNGRVYRLVSFPVKHHWAQRADIDLITQSALELMKLTLAKKWKRVILPRPGCGNGHLQWKNVKPILEPILITDRFVVVSKKGSN